MFSSRGVTGQTFRGSREPLIQVPGAFASYWTPMCWLVSPSQGEPDCPPSYC